jgi:hypothetical protein
MVTKARTAEPLIGASLSGRSATTEAVPPTIAAERAADTTLAESFPASDPPSWTRTIARPGTSALARVDDGAPRPVRSTAAVSPGPAATAEPAQRALLDRLVALAGVTGIALAVPVVILLVGMPVVLLVRVVMAVLGWLGGLFFG